MLKQRVVGSGITIGHHVFQSYEDFALWVRTELPSGRFGLFVDGHSLLDFFSFVGFLDAESVANSFHSSNKSGFKSMLETRVAASMQNFFPAPFGKTAAEKIDDSESLPGIPDPDKFDNGSTGIRYKILRGMKDVSAQLESNIDKVIRDYQMMEPRPYYRSWMRTHGWGTLTLFLNFPLDKNLRPYCGIDLKPYMPRGPVMGRLDTVFDGSETLPICDYKSLPLCT